MERRAALAIPLGDTTQSLLNALNKSKSRIVCTSTAATRRGGTCSIGGFGRSRRFNSAIEKDCRVAHHDNTRAGGSRPRTPLGARVRLKDAHNDAAFETFAREQSNFQTKYALFADDWRVKAPTSGNDAFDATLLQPALATLRHFDLVEELQAFERD